MQHDARALLTNLQATQLEAALEQELAKLRESYQDQEAGAGNDTET